MSFIFCLLFIRLASNSTGFAMRPISWIVSACRLHIYVKLNISIVCEWFQFRQIHRQNIEMLPRNAICDTDIDQNSVHCSSSVSLFFGASILLFCRSSWRKTEKNNDYKCCRSKIQDTSMLEQIDERSKCRKHLSNYFLYSCALCESNMRLYFRKWRAI